MYQFLIGVQIVAILMCLFCFILANLQKETKLVKIGMLISASALIQNAGFLLELTSTDVSSVMLAIKMEYIGGAFIALYDLFFAMEYCRYKRSFWLNAILYSFSIFTLFCVWTYPNNKLYYTGVDFVSTGLIPHVVLEKGPYYIFNTVLLYLEMLACIIILLLRFVYSKQKSSKRTVCLLLFATLLPVFAHILSILNVLNGYDPAPLGTALSVGVFGVTILREHVFDVVENAKEVLMQNIADAIVVITPDLLFEEANDKAKELLPFLKNQRYGRPIRDERFRDLVDNLTDKEIQLGENTFDVHISGLYSKSILIGYSIIFFDVTEHKHQVEDMKILSEQAQSANIAKSTFLTNVSHEIRTPINAVLGFDEVILRDYSEPKLREYASGIHSSAKTLLNLVNQLLDFSKIESGVVAIESGVYNLTEIVEDLVNVEGFDASTKGLKFYKDFGADLPHFLYGDGNKIRQICINLLSNAIRFTDSGSVSFGVFFERVNAYEGNLLLRVKDTGIGIREEDKEKLFDSFIKLDEDNHFVDGCGLGLSITKNLVDMMEGEISVTSEYGKGSTFKVAIPQKLVDEMELIEDEEKAASELKWKRDFIIPDAKILIVDDSKINLRVAEALLSPTQAQITLVENGTECLDVICKEHFDIIFLDHRMPIMDGLETLERMRHMKHMSTDAPVIALTANVVNDAASYYLDIGFDGFLPKPISEQAIDETILKYINKELIIPQE